MKLVSLDDVHFYSPTLASFILTIFFSFVYRFSMNFLLHLTSLLSVQLIRIEIACSFSNCLLSNRAAVPYIGKFLVFRSMILLLIFVPQLSGFSPTNPSSSSGRSKVGTLGRQSSRNSPVSLEN